MAKTICGANFIAGKASKLGSKTFTSMNPRTGEESTIAFHEVTEKEIDFALHQATEAFSVVQSFSIEQRAVFLETVAEEIMLLGEELLSTADWETALGLPRFQGERARTCNQLKLFADYIREGSYVEAIIDIGDPQRKPSPKPDIRRMLFPIGPVAVFGASNFPLAFGVCGGDTASAWAAGCPVIVKAHPAHPQTSELFAHAVLQAIDKCDFPKGWFSLLQGQNVSVSEQLLTHPLLEAVGFTGSFAAGRAIFDLAARREKPIPVYAEMGSINPVFLTAAAIEKRFEQLAQQLSNSITLGVGQFCTKPGVIFIPEGQSSSQKFVQKLTELLAQKEEGVLLNKKICASLSQRAHETLKIEGVRILLGGKEGEHEVAYKNTLLQTDYSTFLTHPELHEEHFGPLAILVQYRSIQDMETIAYRLSGQLTGSIFLEEEDYPALTTFLRLLQNKTGRLIFNGVPTGVEVCYAMQHGGPYPATTAPLTTSVGTNAIKRFLRPVAFQNMLESWLPAQLKNKNEMKILRLVNGHYTRESI